MNKSKRKGTSGENQLVDWLTRWWPRAERRALKGIRDTGDVAGTPFVHECKFAESWPVHKWLLELEAERINAGGALGWISVKRSRRPFVHIIPHDVLTELLDMIYGAPE